jgi:methyl coenzyme M reductase subunit D
VKISTGKTKAMAMEGRQIRRVKIIINGKLIEQVNSFKYLGCNVKTHKINMDLEDNTEKHNKINGIIKRHFGKNMRPQIQVRMYNVLSKPAILYGNETWILRSQDCRRIGTSQMRFLRAIAGVTLRDRIRNEDVRKRLQTGNVVEDIKQYQRKWLEHVERMSPEHLPWQAHFYSPTGRHDLGRPRTRWKQQFQ